MDWSVWTRGVPEAYTDQVRTLLRVLPAAVLGLTINTLIRNLSRRS
jgi:hypothetical protein